MYYIICNGYDIMCIKYARIMFMQLAYTASNMHYVSWVHSTQRGSLQTCLLPVVASSIKVNHECVRMSGKIGTSRNASTPWDNEITDRIRLKHFYSLVVRKLFVFSLYFFLSLQLDSCLQLNVLVWWFFADNLTWDFLKYFLKAIDHLTFIIRYVTEDGCVK